MGILSQTLSSPLSIGGSYRLAFKVSNFTGTDATAAITIRQGTQLIETITASGNFSIDFTADASGDSFSATTGGTLLTADIDSVTLKITTSASSAGDNAIKEFLVGTLDDGKPIFFRVDTQQMQLQKDMELSANPEAIATLTQRGTLLKCFVSLDDDDFYELEGTVNKGVSIVKVHSRSRRRSPSPPLAGKMSISWRDSSKQLCRLVQSAIVFIPGNVDHSE